MTRWLSPAWVLRALLAALLMFASEALLWASPNLRPAWAWLPLAGAYLALAALLLDVAARWRLRDLFGLMALAGVYGLLNAALLNPETAFADFPRTLFTRAMGGHALAGLLALAWWLRLTDARARPTRTVDALIGAAALAVGAVAGFWARFSPPVFLGTAEASPAALAVVFGLLALLLIALAGLAGRHGSITIALDGLRLGWRGGLLATLALIAWGGASLAAGRVDGVELATVAVFTLFCGAIVWFQKRQRGPTLLDARALALDRRRLWVPLAAGAVGLAIGFVLPRGGETDPIAVIGALLTAYGLVWLPLVAFVLGTREFNRLSRAMRL